MPLALVAHGRGHLRAMSGQRCLYNPSQDVLLPRGGGVDRLEDLIRDEIARDGPMTFARFMALALYHPQLGYYSGGGTGREPLGWSGDYITSSDVHSLWGWALARQLHQMWDLLGQPPRFDVIEPGAGRGTLARDVWAYARAQAPDWARALRYTLVDRAAATSPLRRARAERLAADLATLPVPAGAVEWAADPRDLAPGSLVGVIVSNELVDALPVHVVEKRGETLAEMYVTGEEHSGRLVEWLGAPSAQAVATYLDTFHVPWRHYPDGWRGEVRLAAGPWLREAAAPLARGFVLTIDYGDTARRLYTRDRRHGTLLGYAHHRIVEHPLSQPGQQDLTAHVNFTALIEAGRALGLRHVGLTTQADFLRGAGIREEAERIASLRYPAAESERHTDRGQADYLRKRALLGAVATLLNPHGLGGFRVLVQQRGVPGAGRRLLGLGPSSAGL
jgi:SAM-dependent MidA family methyltransferase